MKTLTKRKSVITCLALVATVGSVMIGTMIGKNIKNVVAVDSYTISSLSDFNTYFNGSGTYSSYNFELLADIDVTGVSFGSVRMAGDYSGTFDGNGHTIKGMTSSQNSIFNIVSGEITNLNLEATITGSASRALCYQNTGTIPIVTLF